MGIIWAIVLAFLIALPSGAWAGAVGLVIAMCLFTQAIAPTTSTLAYLTLTFLALLPVLVAQLSGHLMQRYCVLTAPIFTLLLPVASFVLMLQGGVAPRFLESALSVVASAELSPALLVTAVGSAIAVALQVALCLCLVALVVEIPVALLSGLYRGQQFLPLRAGVPMLILVILVLCSQLIAALVARNLWPPQVSV